MSADVSLQRGSLLLVGTGIQAAGQVTIEARSAMEHASKLFYLVADPTTEYYLKSLNGNSESLLRFYENGKERFTSYLEMVSRIMEEVRAGHDVCAAFYGHPGVFAFPPHLAIKLARSEGFEAKMLPGVSAEDCLFADLGIDPAWSGCQSFEATDFLLFKRRFDPNCSLILWQIGVIGHVTFEGKGYDLSGLHVLQSYLTEFYGENHAVIVYEASHDPISQMKRVRVPFSELTSAPVTAESTLYVPPKASAQPDPEMSKLLGMRGVRVRKVTVDLSTSSFSYS